MKKRNEWVTKKMKRRLRKEKDHGIVDFIKVIRHFFKEFLEWIREMDDPRHPSYITYPQEDLVCMGILKNACAIKSMRQMEDAFNEQECIRTLSILSRDGGLEEMPHSDTLNCCLSKLSPECLSAFRRKMVKQLIRSRVFHRARLFGKYWRIIVDGTGLSYFKEKHCSHCLKEVHTGPDGKEHIRYYHKVLEAKIVLGEDLVISIGSEFIENEREDVTKQDCELNAAKRLFARLKKEYPRLPVCVQGDALYETEPFMRLCRENGWHYLLTHKDTRQKAVEEDYALLGDEEKTLVEGIGREKGTGKFYNGVDTLSGKKRKNEGFNLQKNTLYKIGHLNSRNENAMKNHYLLTQIADILMQLYLHWDKMVKEIHQGIKETSSRLLESFRRHSLSSEDKQYIMRRTSMYLR